MPLLLRSFGFSVMHGLVSYNFISHKVEIISLPQNQAMLLNDIISICEAIVSLICNRV